MCFVCDLAFSNFEPVLTAEGDPFFAQFRDSCSSLHRIF